MPSRRARAPDGCCATAVTRAEFATLLAAAASPRPAATPRGVSVEVTLSKETTGELAPFAVAIALRNPEERAVRLRFPTAELFRIDLLHGDSPVWSSLTGHKPIPVTRQIDVPRGLLRLASVIVDGTADDRRALAPGRYTVRVAMLGENFGAVIDKPLVVAPPEPIAKALAAPFGTLLTIAGEPIVEAGVPRLRDASGSIRLSRALGLRPTGRWVVRGYVDALGEDRVFAVGRSAPAADDAATPEAR